MMGLWVWDRLPSASRGSVFGGPELPFYRTDLDAWASTEARDCKAELKPLLRDVLGAADKRMRRLVYDALLRLYRGIERTYGLDTDEHAYIAAHYDEYVRLFLQSLNAMFVAGLHARHCERPFSAARTICMEPVGQVAELDRFSIRHGPVLRAGFVCDRNPDDHWAAMIERDEYRVEYVTREAFADFADLQERLAAENAAEEADFKLPPTELEWGGPCLECGYYCDAAREGECRTCWFLARRCSACRELSKMGDPQPVCSDGCDTRYCSVACKEAHWPRHRKDCTDEWLQTSD